MLPKRSRLSASKFRARGYRTVATPFFSLKVRSNGEMKDRFGIIAGAAVHKTAAKRNFWKRQARAAFAERLAPREGAGGRDIVLIFSNKVNDLTKRKFIEALSRALKQAEA